MGSIYCLMVSTMSTIRKIFEDKDGNVVISQKPNLPIIVWAATYLLQLVPALDSFDQVLELISFGSLFTWAWMEIFDGSSLFRRSLGVIIMVALFANNL